MPGERPTRRRRPWPRRRRTTPATARGGFGRTRPRRRAWRRRATGAGRGGTSSCTWGASRQSNANGHLGAVRTQSGVGVDQPEVVEPGRRVASQIGPAYSRHPEGEIGHQLPERRTPRRTAGPRTRRCTRRPAAPARWRRTRLAGHRGPAAASNIGAAAVNSCATAPMINGISAVDPGGQRLLDGGREHLAVEIGQVGQLDPAGRENAGHRRVEIGGRAGQAHPVLQVDDLVLVHLRQSGPGPLDAGQLRHGAAVALRAPPSSAAAARRSG